MRNDGSLGIHNTKFVVELLQETYEQLTGTAIGTPPPVPPDILHLSELTDCTSCHGVTATVDLFTTGSHMGRINDVCSSCHQQGTPPIVIPSSVHSPMYPAGITASGATPCSTCHATGIGGAPQWPDNHTGRTNNTCNACHSGP